MLKLNNFGIKMTMDTALDLRYVTNKQSTEGVYKSAVFLTLRQLLVTSLQH